MNPRLFLTHVISASLVVGVCDAQAMPPSGRQATGAVREVDRTTRALTISSPGNPQPRVFRWDERTRFVAGGSAITAATVPRGATVAYIDHTPFIGEPFVTKVTVLHPLPMRGKTPADFTRSFPSFQRSPPKPIQQ